MKKYKKQNPSKMNVSEPITEYYHGDFRTFDSFSQMNDSDLKEMASFTPLQRWSHVTELLKHFYSDELKNKFSDYTIYFR